MADDLLQKTDTELKELIIKLKSGIIEHRFKISQGEFKGVHVFKMMKKMIARIHTIFSSRGITFSNTEIIQMLEKMKGLEIARMKAENEKATELAKNKQDSVTVEEVKQTPLSLKTEGKIKPTETEQSSINSPDKASETVNGD